LKQTRKLTARDLALDVLIAVDERDAYSNLALTDALRRARLEARDVGLATELVYGTVGRLNTLDYYLAPSLKTPLHKLDAWVRNLLRMTAYQLFYLERVPAFAAINEAVEIAKRRGAKASGFVNGVLRATLRRKDELKLPSKQRNWTQHVALQHAHPEWLVELWGQTYGHETAEAMCAANNERPFVALRANSHRIRRDELVEQLLAQGVVARPSELSPYGILLAEGLDVTQLPAFRDGLCTVQDESSMLVASTLDPQPGERVLDCCAAPGGKTTHLAELMQDQGDVLAVDIHDHKIELIENVVRRLGLTSIRTRAGDIRDVIADEGPFDRILLDAPCSGLGVIRRKPDLKWKKSPGDVREIAALQGELLRTVAPYLKAGGTLVYSTCTVLPQENEEIVQAFLAAHPDYQLASMRQIFPHEHQSDGFFIARLTRQ